ncbi:sensor histidine kinase [Clostridium omnivorum]|nr:GHKL domain-containing protein [Clostridium sp. E14]
MIAFYDMKNVEALIDKEYQKELLALTDIIRSQRHDFNFHLQAISGMLRNEKYKDCSEYINVMVKEAQSFNEILSLQNPAVGALLNTFREIAARKGIQLQIVIYYNLDKLRCTVYETNKILGNLIQNAIDEVEQHLDDSAWIEVMILKRSGNSVFRVSNKIYENNKALKDIFNSGYSTKKSHEGIGLSTVKKIVEKYNGVVYTEIEGDIIHFIAQIPNGL